MKTLQKSWHFAFLVAGMLFLLPQWGLAQCVTGQTAGIGQFNGNPFDEVCSDEQAVFLASATAGGTFPVASYDWSFTSSSSTPVVEPGGGGGGTGQTATDGSTRRIGATWTNTTNADIMETVTLVTTFENGCVLVSTHDIIVHPIPEVEILAFDGNPFDEVCTDEQAVFLASRTAEGAFPVESYDWSFTSNSSSPVIENGGGGPGTGQTANDGTTRRIGATWTNATNAPIIETVTLTVTYETGCIAEVATHDITINPNPDVSILSFDGNPFDEVCTDEQAVFLASAPAEDMPPVASYQWAFTSNSSTPVTEDGGGGGGTGQLADDGTPRRIGATWTNTTNGNITETVTLMVTYENGCTAEVATHDITIKPNPDAEILAFDGNPFTEVCTDEQAVFLASRTAEGTFPVESYDWTFTSNSSSPVIENGGGGPGTGQTANDGTTRRIGATWTNTTNAPIIETVTLTITYENGCTADVATHDITINPNPDVSILSFDGNPFDEVCTDEQAVFLASPPAEGMPPVASYQWAFTSNSSTPVTEDGGGGGGTGQLADDGTPRRIGATWTNTTNAPITETVTLTVTYENGCTAEVATHDITINPNPDVSILQFDGNPFTETCSDEQAVFLASPPAAGNATYPAVESYDWSFTSNSSTAVEEPGGGGAGTGQLANDGTPRRIGATWTNTTSAPVTETVSLTVTYENGCTAEIATHEVVVLPAPTLGMTYNANPAGGCNSGATICSGSTTDGSFSGVYTEVIILDIRHELEGNDGNICGPGAMAGSGYGPVTGGALSVGDDVSGGIMETLVNPTEDLVRVAYWTEARYTANGITCVGERRFYDVVVNPQPRIECPASFSVFTSNNGTGDCTADASWTHPSDLNGACDDLTLTLSINGATPVVVTPGADITETLEGGENTIAYVLTDGNDNMDDCSFTITVEDDEKPKYSQPTPDVTLYTEDGAACPSPADISLVKDRDNPLVVGTSPVEYTVHGITFETPNASVNDNCTAAEDIELYVWNINDDFGGTADDYQRQIKVTFRIIDEAGNHRNRAIVYTIIDNTPPVLACQDGLTLDFNGEELFYMEDFLADLVDLDNTYDECGGDDISFSYDPAFITCEQLGDVIDVTVTVCDGANNCTSCVVPVTVDGLPCGWFTEENMVDCEGEADYEVPTETFILSSNDCHNPSTDDSDEFGFVQTVLCGDAEIVAQVTSLTGNAQGWAGVMMRESNDPGSKSVALMTSLSATQRAEVRYTEDGTTQFFGFPSQNRHWLKINRLGNQFRLYTSFNGITWFLKTAVSVPMDECLQVGLVVNSFVGSGDHTATFNNVSIAGGAPHSGPSFQADLNDVQEIVSTTARTFTAYPNPTTGLTTVNLADYLDVPATLEVVNTFGQVVFQRRLGPIENAQEDLDLSNLPAGMYIIRLHPEEGDSEMIQIIKQ